MMPPMTPDDSADDSAAAAHATTRPDVAPVRAFLLGLQDDICAALTACDGEANFEEQLLEGERGGLARPRVLEGGPVLERAGVMFSHTVGAALPKAASARRPELAGRSFEAVSVSLITHPRNPYAPTSHMNVRFFIAHPPAQAAPGSDDAAPVWWFGGGFDLTPHYGFDDDAIHWHRAARDACRPFGDSLYPRLKAWCDDYFFIKHRNEPRGIGGVFFDDWNDGGFERAFALMRSVGEHYVPAYVPILERRKQMPYSDRERDFQLLRRGRYVEFNLVWDRGTRFGLEAGARPESLLASMPPLARWEYQHRPEPGSPEAALYERYLVPRDWAGMDGC